MFYPDADDVTAATCDAWHGEVAEILSHDAPGEGEGDVQADPYGCGGLWERFMVAWQLSTQVCHLPLEEEEEGFYMQLPANWQHATEPG